MMPAVLPGKSLLLRSPVNVFVAGEKWGEHDSFGVALDCVSMLINAVTNKVACVLSSGNVDLCQYAVDSWDAIG